GNAHADQLGDKLPAIHLLLVWRKNFCWEMLKCFSPKGTGSQTTNYCKCSFTKALVSWKTRIRSFSGTWSAWPAPGTLMNLCGASWRGRALSIASDSSYGTSVSAVP